MLRLLPSWAQAELSHGHPILIAAWGYLIFGLIGSLGLLVEWSVSVLTSTGGAGNPIWMLAAAALSIFGWGALRRLARRDLSTKERDRRPA